MTTSVLGKARTLQNRARQIEEAQKDALTQERLVLRIEEVRVALATASLQADTALLFQERTGVAVDMSDLTRAYERFATKSRGGLPAEHVYTEARKALDAAAASIASAIRDAWAPWARDCVSAVSSARFAALTPAQRSEAEEQFRQMRALAKRRTIDGVAIRGFCTARSDLQSLLEHAPSEVPPELVRLLERIDAGGLTLRDISSTDIELLHHYDQDLWISVSRKAD